MDQISSPWRCLWCCLILGFKGRNWKEKRQPAARESLNSPWHLMCTLVKIQGRRQESVSVISFVSSLPKTTTTKSPGRARKFNFMPWESVFHLFITSLLCINSCPVISVCLCSDVVVVVAACSYRLTGHVLIKQTTAFLFDQIGRQEQSTQGHYWNIRKEK